MLTRLFFCFFFILLTACAGDDKPQSEENINNDTPSSNALNIPEYKVIEFIADLSANETAMEGIWESVCTPTENEINHFINRRVYHLNGVYHETLLFNDAKCTINNSQITLRLIGTFDVVEKRTIFNGDEDVEINFIEIDFLSAPLIGRPIPIGQLTFDDLTTYKFDTETSKIIENRLYVSNKSNPDLLDLLDDNDSYLINTKIDDEGKTEEDIDLLAMSILK